MFKKFLNSDSQDQNQDGAKSFSLKLGLQFFIPDYGLAKIFDQQGNLVSILQVPAVWQAVSSKGELLAMGVYEVVINGQKLYNLQII